jgi:hypothetical protein
MAASMRTYSAKATRNPVVVVGEPGVTLIDRDNAVVYVLAPGPAERWHPRARFRGPVQRLAHVRTIWSPNDIRRRPCSAQASRRALELVLGSPIG